MTGVTQILASIERSDPDAAEQLLPLVYDELRKLAMVIMALEAPGQTLEPTALVHEAYLRLVHVGYAQRWNSRGHFFAAAAEAMRRILVDQARRKHRPKSGGDRRRVELDEGCLFTEASAGRLLCLHEALEQLESESRIPMRLWFHC